MDLVIAAVLGLVIGFLLALLFVGGAKSENIAELVSANSTFSASDIQAVKDSCNSWDGTIAAIAYAQKNGYTDLQRAFWLMTRENPGQSMEALYDKYTHRLIYER